VPAGAGYVVTATKGTASGSASATVTLAATTNVAIDFTSVGDLRITVRRNGVNVPNATVKITDGPNGITFQTTTNGSGSPVTVTGLPAGSGYTIKAWKTSCGSVSNPKSKTKSGQTVVAGVQTSNTVDFDSSTCPLS
jgi:hypothetical protein